RPVVARWWPSFCSSEQPGEELTGEQRQSAAEHDPRNLALGAAFTEHKHEPADDDRDKRKRSPEGAGKRRLEVQCCAFPRTLRVHHDRTGNEDQEESEKLRRRAFTETTKEPGHVIPPRQATCAISGRSSSVLARSSRSCPVQNLEPGIAREP